MRLAPGYAEAYLNMGVVLQYLGRYQEAEAAYRYALVIKPRIAMAHYDLGVVVMYLGRRDEALSEINEALRIQPDYADARRVLQDLTSSGSGEHLAALTAGSPGAKPHADLGDQLVRGGQFSEAAVQFQEALRLEPGGSQGSEQSWLRALALRTRGGGGTRIAPGLQCTPGRRVHPR